jgi:hypothetical protein
MVQIAAFAYVFAQGNFKKVPRTLEKLSMSELFFVSEVRHEDFAHAAVVGA